MQAIPRHKTAMYRTTVSRPMRLGLESGVISESSTVMDYGCGRGADVRYLEKHGFDVTGWDPAHCPEGHKRAAEVVNLGYVVNVIEDPKERAQTLLAAWHLTQKVLFVSARLRNEFEDHFQTHEDGVVTSRGTFQKFFEQAELRGWIQSTIGVRAIAVGPGVFFVFRKQEDAQSFLLKRFRRVSSAPKVRISDRLYEQHRDLLQPLVEFFCSRGRLPTEEEYTLSSELSTVIGTIAQGWQIVKRVTGVEQWKAIEQICRDDLLVYLALSRFDGRPKKSDLPLAIVEDIRALFGTYKKAVVTADEWLIKVGQFAEIENAMSDAQIGKKTPNAFYVHMSALKELPLLLRLYEGCARGYIGKLEGATLVKLGRDKFKVSYLSYPDFDTCAHPSLKWSTVVPLQTFKVKRRRYDRSDNPPILHRKELFVAPGYERFTLFERLTRSEDKAGLLNRPAGFRQEWNRQVEMAGYEIRGHRLFRRKTGSGVS